MSCQHPDCPNPAQPGLTVPLCGIHASQLVFGFTLPPYQVLVLGQGLEPPADPADQAVGAPGSYDGDIPAPQPPTTGQEEELFGGGHDEPPWESISSWGEYGNGDGSYA